MDIDELRALVDSAASTAAEGRKVDAGSIVRRAKSRQRVRRAAAGVIVVLGSAGALAVFAGTGRGSVTAPAAHVSIVPPSTVAPPPKGTARAVCTTADLNKPFPSMPAPLRVAARYPFDNGGQERLEVDLSLKPAIAPRDAWTTAVAQIRQLERNFVKLPPAGGRAQLLLGRYTSYSGTDVHGKPTAVHVPAWVLVVHDVAFDAMRPGETSSQPPNPRCYFGYLYSAVGASTGKGLGAGGSGGVVGDRTSYPVTVPYHGPTTSKPVQATPQATALSAAIGAAGPGNLVTDGGFEQPSVGTGATSMVIYQSGDTFDQWQASGVVFIHNSFPGLMVAPEGNQALALRSPSGQTPVQPGTVCQSVATTSGSRYRLVFLAATVVKPSALSASIDGSTVLRADLNPDSNNEGVWEPHQADFTATATSTTICLTGIVLNDGGWPVIDAVSVRPA